MSRQYQEGEWIEVTSIEDEEGQHFWFLTPEGWTPDDDLNDLPDVEIHGPFRTADECDADLIDAGGVRLQ